MGQEAATLSACTVLASLSPWSRVSTKPEMRIAACCRIEQFSLVELVLQDGRTIEVRTDAAVEQVVAICEQVMRRNWAEHVFVFLNKSSFMRGRDVFQA